MRFEMQDRVAVGDDKYVLEELGDGRTRITPAPDSVLQEGTPINKEKFQPLFDAAPVHFTLTASGVGSAPVFQNGQTASQLYSDVRNNKPVIVNVIMGETSVPFQVFTSENGNVSFRSATSIVQTPLSLSVPASLATEEQWSFVLRPDSIGNLIATTIQSLDQVESVGKSGIWTYRKWASGMAECWGEQTRETTNWGSSSMFPNGGIYTVANEKFPFVFTQIDSVLTNCCIGDVPVSGFAIKTECLQKQSAAINAHSHLTGARTCVAQFEIKGRWK